MANPSPQYYTVEKDGTYKVVHPIDLPAWLADDWTLSDEKEVVIVKTTSNKQEATDEPFIGAFSPALSGGSITMENSVSAEQGVIVEEATPVPADAKMVAAGEAVVEPDLTPAPVEPTPVVVVESVSPKTPRKTSAPKE